ncbi:MAG: hypothetical protein FVQ79_00530 [Planctomycetes bacterium]|nr:hypothetical protein [Planctomycetota bacterium]
MTRQELLLVILMEESCELAQTTSKAVRFGVNEWHKDNIDTEPNKVRMNKEFNEVLALIEMLDELGLARSPRLIKAKKEKVEKFLLYSEKCGVLSPEQEKG